MIFFIQCVFKKNLKWIQSNRWRKSKRAHSNRQLRHVANAQRSRILQRSYKNVTQDCINTFIYIKKNSIGFFPVQKFAKFLLNSFDQLVQSALVDHYRCSYSIYQNPVYHKRVPHKSLINPYKYICGPCNLTRQPYTLLIPSFSKFIFCDNKQWPLLNDTAASVIPVLYNQ